MKAEIKTTKEVILTTLKVKAGVRYWEDAEVDGVDDEAGDLIPCRQGDYWCPEIDIDSGVIRNWTQGKTAKVHYKVCDDGVYTVLDNDGREIMQVDGCVPNTMSPSGSSYGDYIIMNINESGLIEKFKFRAKDFENEIE